MAKFYRLDVLNEIVNAGVVPLFYNSDFEIVKNVVSACYRGGSKVFEFTNRGDGAFRIFSRLNDHLNENIPDLILGVGSVLDAPTAAQYISEGANFIVGSVLNPEVASLCNRRKVAYLPGCSTASEISNAEALGMELVKVFPGEAAGGPGFVKALLGPTPWSRIMVTGGVKAERENIQKWFGAGATAVGLGSGLIKKDLVSSGSFDQIAELTYQVKQWIREARNEPLFYGVEHIALYPNEKASSQTILDWYKDVFGFECIEGNSSSILYQKDGRIEVVKKGSDKNIHIAIGVSDFESSMDYLKEKGISLEEPVCKEDVKSVYLADKDPLGNSIHLIWRK